jgi:hypothetical protein
MAFLTAWTTKWNDRQSHLLEGTPMVFGMWP